VRLRRSQIRGDHDALAGGERVVFHHVRRAEGLERLGGRLGAGGGEGRGGGDARGPHDVLGVGLRAFDARGGGAGAEDGNPRRPHRVPGSGDQGGLRADDDEVRLDGRGQAGDIGRIVRLNLVEMGQRGDPGVPGRRVQFRYRGVEAEGADNGMLTPSGPDDKYAHLREVTVACDFR
jgi:hypothetical protein